MDDEIFWDDGIAGNSVGGEYERDGRFKRRGDGDLYPGEQVDFECSGVVVVLE